MNRLRVRNLERIFLLMTSVILALLFFRLYYIERDSFKEVAPRLRDGSMVNINEPDADKALRALLVNRFYFEDPADAQFAANAVAEGFGKGVGNLDNIGELNKKAFAVSVKDAAARGGVSFKKRAQLSTYLIGFSQEDSVLYSREQTQPAKLPSVAITGEGPRTISGIINNESEQPVGGVLVRLKLVVSEDSIYTDDRSEEEVRTMTDTTSGMRQVFLLDSSGARRLLSFTAFARTDGSGSFAFKGLPAFRTYEVLPLQPGYQFGGSKGVQRLEEDVELEFRQVPHTMKLFATHDFNNPKREKALIVRTPDYVTKWFTIIAIGFPLSLLFTYCLPFDSLMPTSCCCRF